MADKLTPQQAQAVHDRGGTLLVSAAAGSGKTKVLVDRLLTYLNDPRDPADLDSFLIITYTKAAATELRGKIAAKLTERIAQNPESRHLQKQMQRLYLTKISTVHGLCSDLLREYAYMLNLPADFRVADEQECFQLREQVLTDLMERAYAHPEEHPHFLSFVNSQGLGRNDGMIPFLIGRVYDSARCHCDPEAWLRQCEQDASVSQIRDPAQTIWGRYLVQDLQEYLECQIAVIRQCVRELEASEGVEKQAAMLGRLLLQLQQLRSANSWDEVIANAGIVYDRWSFPKKNVDLDLGRRVKAARDACKVGLEKKLKAFVDDSDQVLQDLAAAEAGVRGLIALVRQFDRDYQALKRSKRVLDFSDLEQKTLDLLLGKSRSGRTAAAREIAGRFREVLVDEYQDSNAVQDAIFEALTADRQNCFLVGDVKQSIYQFRLADPGIFLEKYNRFVPAREAAAGQGRKVLLSHNFRSGGEIVEAVNQVFATCMRPRVGGLYYGEEEALREGIPHQALPDGAVELYAMDTDGDSYEAEAAFVAERIHQMLQSGTMVRDGEQLRPVRPEDIVILLRSPGSAGAVFQQALEAKGIRYASGSGMDLLRTEEVLAFRALLQAVSNPQVDIPLLAVLASPVFGFSAEDLASLRARQKKGSIYNALKESDSPKAQHFRNVLEALREEARRENLTVLMERCFALTRMDSIYAAMDGGDLRLSNLQMLYQLAVNHSSGGNSDLNQFLEYLDSLEGRGIPARSSGNSGCVTIMSIHKSKGLEFPVVFLCNLSRGFNQEGLKAQILCDQTLGIGLSAADNAKRVRYPTIAKRAIAVKMAAESLSEEMRVLYVAMTRARDRLVMTCAPKGLEKKLTDMASRFDFDRGELLCRGVSSMGDWILISALRRMEAGQLHGLADRPGQLHVAQYPWKIQLVTPAQTQTQAAIHEDAVRQLPEGLLETLEKSLSYHYPYLEATQAPSKQTATGLKGRIKDEEAAEGTALNRQPYRSWRRPSFHQGQVSGRVYGNIIHTAMQYLPYENCGSEDAIQREISILTERGLLTPEQADAVNCRRIAAFFASEIGQKLRAGVSHVREFKFSILDDAEKYAEHLEGEQVLLQGVVDCALLEDDGITVIDFKTDRVTDQTLPQAVKEYSLQVNAYAQALSRIFQLPVKAKFLYFFQLDQFADVI